MAATISFNPPPDGSLSTAQKAIDDASREIGSRAASTWSAAAAQAYAQSTGTIPRRDRGGARRGLHRARRVLREGSIHPLTILSTSKRPGRIGATLALLDFGTLFRGDCADRHHPAGLGIVKKNGIMMVDVAIQLQRKEGMAAKGDDSRCRSRASAARS